MHTASVGGAGGDVAGIRFSGVHVRRGNIAVLRGLTLGVGHGEVVALVGRSGAGKTTVLKLVNCLLFPDAGVVAVEGRDTRTWNPIELRRRTGYVIQQVGLFPHMTVERNVGLVPALAGWPADRIRRRAHELLDLVGLPPESFAARWPHELSGGQQQRVGVARALALDPPVLLMDEPFGALDPVTRAEMHMEFCRIQALLRKTVLLVTHDMNEACVLAHRIGILEEGQLIASGTPEMIAQSLDPRVRRFLVAVAGRAGAEPQIPNPNSQIPNP